MIRKSALFSLIFILALLAVVGCGVPKQDYEAAIAERESAQTELKSVKEELQSLKGELESARAKAQSAEAKEPSLQSELDVALSKNKSLETQLATAAAASSALRKKLDLVEQVLAFEATVLRTSDASAKGNTDLVKQ